MFFDIFAFAVFAVLFLAIVAAIVVLGALPGNIARRRHHPQADAITAAGWMGIASLGILWPLAFVWAFLRPSPQSVAQTESTDDVSTRLTELQARLDALETPIQKQHAE
jgi:hypothetical protein